MTILGNEFAGEVEAVGGGVTSFKVGDRVFGYSGGTFGAHAEYMSIPRGRHARDHAGGPDLRGGRSQHRGFALRPGDDQGGEDPRGQNVLVYGATGAIGSAAVQLLKSLGADVTAVCGTQHVELVRGLGADRVIDYTAEDFTKDDQTYDVVIDAVGKSTFGRCKRLLKPRGIYLSSELGPLAQNPFLALITPLLGGKKVVFPIPKQDPAMVRLFQGPDRVRRVQAGHRPTVSVGPDRRGLPVRRDRPEDRQRRDQHRAFKLGRPVSSHHRFPGAVDDQMAVPYELRAQPAVTSHRW